MTQHDPIEADAMEMLEEFNELIKKYNDQDVVIRAVTGILASVAKAASVSPAEGKALVETIAAEASEAIEDMYEIEKAITRRNRPGPHKGTLPVGPLMKAQGFRASVSRRSPRRSASAGRASIGWKSLDESVGSILVTGSYLPTRLIVAAWQASMLTISW